MVFDPVVGERFGFDADDLTANRVGALSPAQERLLDITVSAQERHARRSAWLVGGARALAVVLAGAAIGATPGAGVGTVALAAAILAGVMGLVLWAVARGRRTREAMGGRRLLTAEGPLQVRTSSTGTWYAHVGEARFGVDRYQSEALQEDGRYRIHYLALPDGAMPLSIEAIDE